MTRADREYHTRVIGEILDEIQMDAECFPDGEQLVDIERVTPFTVRIAFERNGSPVAIEASVSYFPFYEHYEIRLKSQVEVIFVETKRPWDLEDVYLAVGRMADNAASAAGGNDK